MNVEAKKIEHISVEIDFCQVIEHLISKELGNYDSSMYKDEDGQIWIEQMEYMGGSHSDWVKNKFVPSGKRTQEWAEYVLGLYKTIEGYKKFSL